MKKTIILIFAALVSTSAFSQCCPDDFWKQAVLVGQTTIEIQLKKGQSFKPVIIERKDTTTVETWVLTKKTTTTPTPVIIEQIVDGEQATFSSNWTYHGQTNASGWHQNTIAYSNVTGSTVSFTFTGRKIELWAETMPSHGTGTIKIDNEAEVSVSFVSPTKALPAKVFERSWTTDGQHTIVLKSVSGYVLCDYFKVFKSQ